MGVGRFLRRTSRDLKGLLLPMDGAFNDLVIKRSTLEISYPFLIHISIQTAHFHTTELGLSSMCLLQVLKCLRKSVQHVEDATDERGIRKCRARRIQRDVDKTSGGNREPSPWLKYRTVELTENR